MGESGGSTGIETFGSEMNREERSRFSAGMRGIRLVKDLGVKGLGRFDGWLRGVRILLVGTEMVGPVNWASPGERLRWEDVWVAMESDGGSMAHLSDGLGGIGEGETGVGLDVSSIGILAGEFGIILGFGS